MQHSTAHSKAKAAAPRLTPRESLCVCCSSLSDGVIKYKELHKLLIRSVQSPPRLEPLVIRAGNAKPLRTASVSREDANTLGTGIFASARPAAPSKSPKSAGKSSGKDAKPTTPPPAEQEPIANQIRTALQNSYSRVIDLFRQMDDDHSGTRHQQQRSSSSSATIPLSHPPSLPPSCRYDHCV